MRTTILLITLLFTLHADTLRDEIARMLIVGFEGTKADANSLLVRTIRRYPLGGVILFDRNVDGSVQNIRSPGQLRKLTAQLQAMAPELLLIAVDQEGGKVCRLKERDGFPASTAAAVLGQGSPSSLRQMSPSGGGGAWGLSGVSRIPLLEEMVRAYSREPEKIERIRKMLEKLEKVKQIEDVVPPEFTAVWQAFLEGMQGAPA